MSITRIVRLLTIYQLEFSCMYDKNDKYCLNIILGNREYLIDVQDHRGLEKLWFELQANWLYN